MTETARFTIILSASVPIEDKEGFETELRAIAQGLTEVLNKEHPAANATLVWETKK